MSDSNYTPPAQSEEFKKAVQRADDAKVHEKHYPGTGPQLKQDQLLEMYGLFKQAVQDPPFEQSKKPGFMDIAGKYKYNAWKKFADEGLTAQEAQKRYVEFIDSVFGDFEFKTSPPE